MQQIDNQLFLYLNSALSGPPTALFFSLITYLGNGLVTLLFIILPLYFLDRAKLRTHLLAMVLSTAVSGAIVNVIKPVVDRPRPADYFGKTGVVVHTPLGTPPDKAFPSGHTQTAFGAATYLGCMYPRLSPLFLILAAGVGLSRIALGVHYPSDVAVGALFGIVFALIGYRVRSRLRPPPFKGEPTQ